MGTTPAGRIFVSYRRDDSAYATGWLTDRLAEHYGAGQVFTDVDSIEIGDDFVRRISDAVASCDVLLAVIGPKWLAVKDDHGRRRLEDPDDYVRIEIEAALRRGVLVIPILIDGATMPRSAELPGGPEAPGAEPDPQSLAALTRREALSLSPSQFDWAVERLLAKLDKVLLRSHVVAPGDDTTHKPHSGEPPPPHRPARVLNTAVRWGIAGCLVLAIAVLVFAAPLVVPDVQTARAQQPQSRAWIWLIWMLPAIPAAVGLASLVGNPLARLGTILGCTAVAGWLVTFDWAFLAHAEVDPHTGVHATLAFLLLAATIGVATAAPVRERLGPNATTRAGLALCLAVLGLVLRTQAKPVGDAITGSSAGVDWSLHLDRGTFWVGQVVPFAVCVAAAVIRCNDVQSRALRTFVGVVVICDVGLAGSMAANQLGFDPVDVGILVQALLFVLGSLSLWRAVRVGQPKLHRVSRSSPRPGVTAETQ